MVVFLLAMISLSIAMKRKKDKIIAMKHRPLIAILSNKEVNRNYIEWIRSGGADVITSFYNDNNINETLDKANEVVMYYTERETNQTLFNTAKNVYNEIKRKNKEYYYPIIAIGEGCNVVQLAEMNMTDTIQYGEYDEKIDYRINFMNDNISNIKLFFYFDGRDLLNIRNMTFNMKTNHSGLDLATYANEEELIKNINPIGYIQHDTDKVVTLLEGKKFPLFGMLFDIVKYIYEDKNKDIKESLITIGQKILNFIVKEAYDGMLNKQVMNIKKNHMKIEKEDNCTKSKVNDTNVIIKEEKKIDIIEVMKENRNETIFKKIKKEIKKYIDNKKNKNNNNTVIDSKKDVNVTEIDKEDEVELIPHKVNITNNTLNDTKPFNNETTNSTTIIKTNVTLSNNSTEKVNTTISVIANNSTKKKKVNKVAKSNSTNASNVNKTEINKLIKKSKKIKKKSKHNLKHK